MNHPLQNIPDEEIAFETIFKIHYKGMFCYACTMLQNEDDAKEITQAVFVKLWEKKAQLTAVNSLKAYLYRMVHNDCMNWLKHEMVVQKFAKEKSYTMKNEEESEHARLESKQLEERLVQALRELPNQCRTIFQLSRFEDLKYREIAAQLSISEKTVENQMGKALKLLRIKLAAFLTAFIGFVMLLKK